MYRWIDHTGEAELEIEGDTEQQVFAEAFAALSELLREGSRIEPEDGAATGVERRISVAADDRDRLLAGWLAELAFLAETEGLVPTALGDLRLGPASLDAIARGYVGDPPHLVKAVTYHRLAFEPIDDGWRARVVLDV